MPRMTLTCEYHQTNFAERNFHGSELIHEKHKNYTPRKFGAIQYSNIQYWMTSGIGLPYINTAVAE